MKRQTALRKIRKAFKTKDETEIVVLQKFYKYALEVMNKSMVGKKYLIKESEYNAYILSSIFDSEDEFTNFACRKTVRI